MWDSLSSACTLDTRRMGPHVRYETGAAVCCVVYAVQNKDYHPMRLDARIPGVAGRHQRSSRAYERTADLSHCSQSVLRPCLCFFTTRPTYRSDGEVTAEGNGDGSSVLLSTYRALQLSLPAPVVLISCALNRKRMRYYREAADWKCNSHRGAYLPDVVSNRSEMPHFRYARLPDLRPSSPVRIPMQSVSRSGRGKRVGAGDM
ncbi:hypothetical protein C8Q74DRAFT_327219 [Fomes fomentarius]|nr:hypothetical protein C8Q74DRAFT_327219 [Fomes fomentarius]